MKSILSKLLLTTGLVLGVISFNANAGLMTSGTWSDIEGNAVVLGVDTDKIYWGSNNPDKNSNGKNSSWLFEGVSSSDPWVDGEYFSIGWFTHENMPIYDWDFQGLL